MSKSAFERYAPFIQEYIYRKGWTDLREVQVEACEAIMDADSHVIIASGTASGKTEAAFFPMLTMLEQHPSKSVGIMYIGPLKALINDQFARLNELLEEQDIPVWPWHGDVSQSVKAKALRSARGVVQITPESLEALLMRHPGDAGRLFSDLRFIVIDEIHALMGEDRGLQVLCLMARLEKIAGCRPRRIALSATLNDYRPAMDFLSAGSDRGATAVGIQSHKRTVSLCAESFFLPADELKAARVKEQYNQFLYDNSHAQKCLIFTNSRSNAEEIIANMKAIASNRGERDVFHVHHGSISAALRQEAEQALKENDGPTVAAATLTLELGIDIGDLDSTIQAGAPYSCSSFVQRLGRSGRRTGKSRMMFVNLHEESDDGGIDALPWDLLRSIAIIQLYLEERWVEPFEQKKKPFSLLAHQTLSALMTHGELSPAELARRVLLLPPFRNTVSADEYRQLLRHMLQEEYLQRMEGGGLIVGLKGERRTGHFSFYAVFKDEETYRVVSKDGEVGTLTKCPEVGEVFVLGGRAWRALSVDEDKNRIFVELAKSSRIPSWSGMGGDIHTRIVQRMKRVLEEDAVYPYLQPNAAKLLQDARLCAKELGLMEKDVHSAGAGSFVILPWVGTKELRTIAKLLSCGLKGELGVLSVELERYFLRVRSVSGAEKLLEKFRACEIDPDSPDLVLSEKRAPRMDKYDSMVPDALLREAFLHNHMDAAAAVQILNGLKLEPIRE